MADPKFLARWKDLLLVNAPPRAVSGTPVQEEATAAALAGKPIRVSSWRDHLASVRAERAAYAAAKR